MAAAELIPQISGRPSIIVHEGWTVFISIRDAEYNRMMKSWKRMLRDAHPDRGGNNTKFRKIMGQRLKWQCQEAQWYSQYGLYPPDGFKHAEVIVERKKLLQTTSQYERKLAREEARRHGAQKSDANGKRRRRVPARGDRSPQSAHAGDVGGLGNGEGPAETSGGD